MINDESNFELLNLIIIQSQINSTIYKCILKYIIRKILFEGLISINFMYPAVRNKFAITFDCLLKLKAFACA